MTEAELQDAIVELAQLFGWRVAHFRAGRTSSGWRTACQYDAMGFPDLVLVRERVLFVELKSAKGSLRPDQKAWLDSLSRSGAECFVWRPQDWTAGTIERVLRCGSA